MLANEDYTGFNPTYPPDSDARRSTSTTHVHARSRPRATARTSGTSTSQGVPHHLGVLGHYKAVVWYLGRQPATPRTRRTCSPTPAGWYGELPDIGVAERQQYLTMAVRDYLNEGGKLLHTGETAAVLRHPRRLDRRASTTASTGDPTAECVVTTGVQGFFDDCLLLADDFRQYYLGAYARGARARTRPASPAPRARSTGVTGTVRRPAPCDNPLDEAGRVPA